MLSPQNVIDICKVSNTSELNKALDNIQYMDRVSKSLSIKSIYRMFDTCNGGVLFDINSKEDFFFALNILGKQRSLSRYPEYYNVEWNNVEIFTEKTTFSLLDLANFVEKMELPKNQCLLLRDEADNTIIDASIETSGENLDKSTKYDMKYLYELIEMDEELNEIIITYRKQKMGQ